MARNDSDGYDIGVEGAHVDTITQGPNSQTHYTKNININKKPPSWPWVVALAIVGVVVFAYLNSNHCKLASWDGVARGWGKDGQCSSPDARGYFLRVSYGHGLSKDAARKAVEQAWSKYVHEYHTDGVCLGAKEMIFFDAKKNPGAGILFEAEPPEWEQLLKDHPEWVPLGKDDQPVVSKVCFFVDNSRMPSTW